MKNRWSKYSVKATFFIPLLISIVLSIVTVTAILTQQALKRVEKSLENELRLEVTTIIKMLERERALQLNKVKTNLKIAHDKFYSTPLRELKSTHATIALNQISKKTHQININQWSYQNNLIYNDSSFVDKLQALFGGTITIFQKIDSGYLRISTNVLKVDGSRAVGTYIPNNSPVIKAIEEGKTFYGRAYVVNDWYTTAYQPIIIDAQIKGILYVGDKEKDLNELKNILSQLKIRNSGFPYLIDHKGNVIFHPSNAIHSEDIELITTENKGNFRCNHAADKDTWLSSFEYFPEFKLYVVATINQDHEIAGIRSKTIIHASLVGLGIIIILTIIIFLFTTENLTNYLKEIEDSQKHLSSTQKALRLSENRFQLLFNNSVDDIFLTDEELNIIEVNHSACETLGYTREEFLKMSMKEIKSPIYVDMMRKNQENILKVGHSVYESEHVTKKGKVLPIEMKTRVINYGGENIFFSIARNISERREMEQRILKAVINAEENERERYSKEIHDGLGPLLSTIKLYINEFTDEEVSAEERENHIAYTIELIDDAINTTRNISNNIMPRMIKDYGLIKALESFFKKINNTNTISINLAVDDKYEDIEKGDQLILFRVITELVNNTLKHAKASFIKVDMHRKLNHISIAYRDNGIGFNVDRMLGGDAGGMGLQNIISRIKSINGTCDFESKSNEGTIIKIELAI